MSNLSAQREDPAVEGGDLSDLIDTVAVGVIHTDLFGSCLFVNEAWSRLTGLAAHEAHHQGWLRAIDPGDRARVMQGWAEAVSGLQAFEMKYRVRRPDGTTVQVCGRASPIRDRRGEVSGYGGIVFDISRRHDTERALQASEASQSWLRQRFDDVIELLPNAVGVFDADLRLTLFNRSFRELYPEQADIIVAGARMEDLMRDGLRRGLFPSAEGCEEIWIRQHLDHQRALGHDVRERLVHNANGWIQIRERRLADGSIVSVRADVTSVKEAQDRLVERTTVLNATLDHMAQGFIMLDGGLRVTAHNAQAETMLGLRQGMLAEHPTFAVVERHLANAGTYSPGAQPLNDPGAADLLRTTEYPFARQWRHPDDLAFELSFSPLAGGGWVLTISDVTGHVRQERRLRQQADVLSCFSALIADAGSGFDDKIARLLQLGADAFALPMGIVSRVTGETFRVEHVVGPPQAPSPGDTFDLGVTYCTHTLATGAPLGFHKAGDSPIRDHPCYRNFKLETYIGVAIVCDGEVYGTLNFSGPDPRAQPFGMAELSLISLMAQWVGGQLSRRRAETRTQSAESERAQHAARLALTLENMDQGITMFDADLKLVTSNRRYYELMDLPKERFGPGMAFEDVIRHNARRGDYGPGTPEAHVETMRALVLRREPHLLERHFPDGRVLEIHGTPIADGGFVTTYTDITERKRVESMKNAFIATVSHELRTPLTSISGALGLVAGGVAGDLPETARHLIAVAERNSRRLVALVNDILDMEKIQSGRMDYDFRPLDMVGLLQTAIDAIRPFAEQLGATVRMAPACGAPRVRGDATRLGQVVTNLLSNAVKFSPADGNVDVEVQPCGNWVRVKVSDEGPGISQDFRERIFVPFSQADSSDSRKIPGTGLGLAISKAIVEKHGGTIGFDTCEGRGTTFFFDTPVWGKDDQ